MEYQIQIIMIETLIAILMTLGLNFGKTDSGTISLNSESRAILESSSEFGSDPKNNALLDIVVTDDDDPISKSEAAK